MENLIRLPRGVCVTLHEPSPTHYHHQDPSRLLFYPTVLLPFCSYLICCNNPRVCSSFCFVLFTHSPLGAWPTGAKEQIEVNSLQLYQGCEVHPGASTCTLELPLSTRVEMCGFTQVVCYCTEESKHAWCHFNLASCQNNRRPSLSLYCI